MTRPPAGPITPIISPPGENPAPLDILRWAINTLWMIDTPRVGLIHPVATRLAIVTQFYPPDWILVIRPLLRLRLQCGFYSMPGLATVLYYTPAVLMLCEG